MDSLLSILPNLSVPVVAVLALAYLSLKHSETQNKSQEEFIKTLDSRAMKHENAMQERETALRGVEKEIRTELVGVLTRSNDAIAQNTRVMERVVEHMDKH